MILYDIFLNHKINYISFNLFNLKYDKKQEEEEKKINEINSINFILHNKKNNFIINNFINESLKFNTNFFNNNFQKKNKIIIHINFNIFNNNIDVFLSHLFFYLKNKNINLKNIIILFNESTESRDENTLNVLNNLILKKQNIYNFKYFIMTCNAKFKNHSKIIFFPNFNYYFLHKKIGSKKPTSDIFNIFLKYKKNNKTFLFYSLNRVIRNHRVAFLYYLKSMSFKNDYLISFDEIKKNQYFNNLYEEYLIDANKLFEIKTPIILDVTNFKINQADHIGPFYINSFFSQVNETLVDNQNIFLSEKTFKPIIRLSPFIIFGNPNTLKELSAWDFEVNFKGINNSYDNEENNLTRLHMILNEMKKLDLPKKDLLDFYYQNREILIYNYDRYFNLSEKDILEKTNFKKILDEYEKT
jgi:hypothetical protein